MEKTSYIIRKYNLKDKPAIREICSDTGLLGNPINKIFSDREIFADLITNYYLKKEPNNTFVIESNKEIIGYLTGSLNKFARLGLILNGIKPITKAVYNQLTGKYNKHPQNKEFLKWILTKLIFCVPNHPKKAAHAHFNLKSGFRHKGIGTNLIETALKNFASKLKQKNIKKIYGEVVSHSKKSEEYFKKAGFDIFDKRETTLFKDHIKEKVYLMCITKDI